MQYNENKILTGYIWNHYQHLMTEFEREVGLAIIGREKAKSAGNQLLAEKLNMRFGRIHRQDINQALEVGPETFRQMVRERILKEYTQDIFINRCPVCNLIVRTPIARLCTWCGHTWFVDEQG